MLETLSNTICLINQKLRFPAYLALILEVLSCFQILQLILETMASFPSSHRSILTILTKTLPFFTAAFNFDSFSALKAVIHPAWYLISFYLFGHVLLIILAVIIFKFKQTFKTAILKILAFAYTIHSRILFFPIHYFYLTLINLYKEKHHSHISLFYSHPTWLAITILFLVENFLLVIIKEFLLYQIIKSKDSSAVKTNLYHQIIAAHKICLPIILILVRNMEVTSKLSSILHLIFSLAAVGILYRCLPFYKFKILKVSVVMSTINLSVSLVGVLQAFVKDSQFSSSLQAVLFILPVLGVKISLGMFKGLLGRISVMNIKSPLHAIHFFLLMKEAYEDNETSEYKDKNFLPEKQLIIGFFARNGVNLLDMKDPVLKECCEEDVYTLILEKFEERHRSSPKNELLLSFIIKIYIKKFGNIAKGTHYLKKIENLGYSIHIKSYVNDFHSRLEEMYNKEELKDDAGLKLSKYFSYKEMANSVKSDMLKEIDKHETVWEHLQGDVIDIKEIIDVVENIDRLYNETQKKFQRNFEEFKTHFPLPILMYAAYLHSIRCLPSEADQLFKKFQAIILNKQSKHDFDTYSDTSAVIIVSLDPRKAGQIIDATGSVQNLFAMKKNEVIGFNFARLFPNSIAKAFQQEVSRYAKAPTYKLDKRYQTYGRTGTGEFFELEAHLKLHSYGNKELTLAILFNQLSGPKSVFIADPSGHLIECSKDLKDNLQQEELRLRAFRCMQDIATEFEVVNQAFNQIYHVDEITSRTITNLETRLTTRFADGRLPIFPLETDAISARPLLHSNTEILAFQTRDDEPLAPMASDPNRRSLQKSTFDRFSSGIQHYRQNTVFLPANGELGQEQAKKICEKFMQGRRLEILPGNRHKIKANIKIKPLVLNREVHKIIFLTSIEREKGSLVHLDENENSQESEKIPGSFADVFPDGSEGLSLKQSPHLSPLKSPGKQTTLQAFIPSLRNNLDFEVFSSETLKSPSQPSPALNKRQERMIREIKPHQESIPDSIYREGGGLKALKTISSSTKMLPSMRSLFLTIYLILLFVVILAGFSTGMSRESINEVSYAVQIVDLFTLRSFTIEQFWQYTTILYAGGQGLVTLPNATQESIRSGLNTAKEYLVPSNSKVKNLLGKLDSKYLIRSAYKRDIAFYNSHGTDIQKDELEIFSATDLLLAKYEPVITTYDLKELADDPDIPFLLNNTGNDYFIKSRNLNDFTSNFLKETTASKAKSLRIVLAVQILALFFLTAALVLIPFAIINAYKRLLKALLRIEDARMNQRLNTIQTVQALFNKDIEEKSFILDAYKQFSDPETRSLSKKPRSAKDLHQYTMSKTNKYFIKLVLIALAFIPIFMALFAVALNRSIDTFQSFSVVNDELTVLKDCWDHSSTFLGSFVFSAVFLSKSNMLIKENTPIEQLRFGLEAFQSINEKLTRTFLKGDETDPFIESIFKNSICENLKVEKYQAFCIPATQGGTLGMLAVNEDYISASNKYVGAYLSYPSLITLAFVAKPYMSAISDQMKTLNVIYMVLIKHVRDVFLVEVEKSLQRELDYLYAVLSVAVVYLLFIYLVPVRKLKRADNSRRKILKVIPLKMIQENKIFSWYMVREFQDEVPSIKKYF